MPIRFKASFKSQDRGLDKLIASLRMAQGSTDALWAGVAYPERTYPAARGSATVGLVGMAHEFGAPSSKPPTTAKHWLRGTFNRNQAKYAKIVKDELGKQLDKSKTISNRRVFLRLGPVIRKDLRATINGMGLVDTGLLRRSVGFRIGKREK